MANLSKVGNPGNREITFGELIRQALNDFFSLMH